MNSRNGNIIHPHFLKTVEGRISNRLTEKVRLQIRIQLFFYKLIPIRLFSVPYMGIKTIQFI